MPVEAISLSPAAARRFQLHALGLDRPHPDIGAALAHHGYIQIDPISVCGRMQDHILRNRVAGYREHGLFDFLHGSAAPLPPAERNAFEHHLPSTGILVALEATAWPHLREAMERRTRRAGAWSGKLTPREKDLALRIFDEIGERGPLGSEDIEDGRRARQFWGSATLVKSTMQKLFFHGRLLIAGRDRGRRLYDLPERVLAPRFLELKPTGSGDIVRWETTLRLRQRRLAAVKRTELPHVEDRIVAVSIQGLTGRWYALREDRPLLEAAAAEQLPRPSVASRLLAPLDPLIYDRSLTLKLWGFDYTWEVYTPSARRKRGYYALPVLSGDELVGHVDAKLDRQRGKLITISRQIRRGHQASGAIRELEKFLGASKRG